MYIYINSRRWAFQKRMSSVPLRPIWTFEAHLFLWFHGQVTVVFELKELRSIDFRIAIQILIRYVQQSGKQTQNHNGHIL